MEEVPSDDDLADPINFGEGGEDEFFEGMFGGEEGEEEYNEEDGGSSNEDDDEEEEGENPTKRQKTE